MKPRTCVRRLSKSALGLRAAFRRGSMTGKPGTVAPRPERTEDAMSLSKHNEKWKAFLKSDSCPPILGLVPLSEADSRAISELVATELACVSERQRYETMLHLLKRHASAMTVWLARKAGESYEAGAFYQEFEAALGIHFSLPRRADFARWFWQTCYLVMPEPPDVTDWGSRPHVEKFLFQAGLPLCHCQTFAAMLRAVERSVGLPDPEASEAGEELRENMLARPELAMRPTLKRALQGPAGTFLCLAALRVVLEGNFAGINPQLGEQLARAFESCTHDQLRRAARQPFARLASHCLSLEIVGPKQDAHLLAGGGVRWVVNGEKHRVPAADELVLPVPNRLRLSVELHGLLGVQPVLRTFVLDLEQREQPFMLFDYESRKLRREGSGSERTWHLKSGQYWLLHSVDSTISEAQQRIDWADGKQTLSLIRIRPGAETRLETANEAPVFFKADQSPFFEPQSEVLLTDDDERIHYGWTEFPSVWLPMGDSVETDAAGWSLRLTAAGKDETWTLKHESFITNEGGMFKCAPVGASFLRQLPSGLHEVDVSVLRGSRQKMTERFLLWVGLQEFRPGDRFVLSSFPANLERDFCQGFKISTQVIVHLRDHSPEHALAFVLGDETRFCKWHQAGTFLFSAEKRPGQPAQWIQHRLGESFSAAVDSCRWLRLRREPPVPMELLVNAAVVHRVDTAPGRSFLDLSLAELATRFPEGGRVSLRVGGVETIVAQFTRPLAPISVRTNASEAHHSLELRFADEVLWARPRLRELISGRVIEFKGGNFAEVESCVFPSPELPELACGHLEPGWMGWQAGLEVWEKTAFNKTPQPSEMEAGHCLYLNVPKSGWPEGFWMVELEVRRHESTDWQLAAAQQGQQVAVLVASPPSSASGDFRFDQFWRAYAANAAGTEFHLAGDDVNGHEAELCDLLAEIQSLIRPGFAEAVQPQFHWLESLYRELGKQAGRVLATGQANAPEKLLNLACHEAHLGSGRSLFVTVPGLLALPAERYSEIPTTQPLPTSLNWCAHLARHRSVFDAFKKVVLEVYENPSARLPETFKLLQHFGNFTELVQAGESDGVADDFWHFDFGRYRGHTIGYLRGVQAQPEWDERTLLGRSHVEWALNEFGVRRQAALDSRELGAVNALLNAAPAFRDWLRHSLSDYSKLMPLPVWNEPWLFVTFADDALMENCTRFASLFALAARASAAGWLRLEEVIAWLGAQTHGQTVAERTVATLVGMAPELFGYYLMFWELMIRTYPHD